MQLPHIYRATDIAHVIESWSELEAVVSYAVKRHGYTNTDSFFGVTYPSDLDDFDRVQGEHIPPGFVRILNGYGDPNGEEFDISESDYLVVLRAVVENQGRKELIDELERCISVAN
ncbi:MAG: hypothetical protein AAFR97_15490 [Bacteroidota bacterium]